MVYREPEANASESSQNAGRAQAEHSNPSHLLSPRLTGSYASQQSIKQEFEPLTQSLASSVSQTEQDETTDGVFTQKGDETLTNDDEPGILSQPDNSQQGSSQAGSSQTVNPSQNPGQPVSHNQPKNPNKRPVKNPDRVLPYIKPRVIERYPRDLPPAGGETIASAMQQHLLYLLPCLEEAISDWNQAATEEAQAYWWDVVQSIQGRVDHACDVMSRFLPAPETKQDPHLGAYVSLLEQYWRRPPQEKHVFVRPPEVVAPLPTAGLPSWGSLARDENIVVVDE
ncbi:hypothetical protein BGX26_012189 [Mortierella sp. AD094]|nr:hypothetical protein BGX26_012189 [Mortierella sp. AD094]